MPFHLDTQYHGCLWHDDIRSLVISRCDIDQVCTKYFLPAWKGLTLKTSDPILPDLVMAFRLMAVLSEIYWLLISEVLCHTCHAKAILQQVLCKSLQSYILMIRAMFSKANELIMINCPLFWHQSLSESVPKQYSFHISGRTQVFFFQEARFFLTHWPLGDFNKILEK